MYKPFWLDSQRHRVQDMRIDFQFDRAAFDFKRLPFKVPYPVPFKLLGDETKVSANSNLLQVIFNICILMIGCAPDFTAGLD